jgi:hypothetical protein
MSIVEFPGRTISAHDAYENAWRLLDGSFERLMRAHLDFKIGARDHVDDAEMNRIAEIWEQAMGEFVTAHAAWQDRVAPTRKGSNKS